MSVIAIFGFQVLWSPLFGIFLLSILVLYYMIIGPIRSRFIDSESVTAVQKLSFTTGILLLYVVLGSPVDVIGHILFSVHMLEMAVMLLIVPPLLLLGIPIWLLQIVVSHKILASLLLRMNPLVALFLFNGLFSVYHVPFLFDMIKQSQLLHSLTLCVLFFTSLMMWWPILNPLPAYQLLSDLKKIAYMFASGILLTPACALIIFASAPLYATYSLPQAWMQAMDLCVPFETLSTLGISGPEYFHWLPLLEDQQAGGVVMKIIQEIVYIVVIGHVFFQWVKKEKKKEEEWIQPYEGVRE